MQFGVGSLRSSVLAKAEGLQRDAREVLPSSSFLEKRKFVASGVCAIFVGALG